MDDDTRAQIDRLHASGFGGEARPLLVCDVDEVVLHLVTPFQRVLDERGYELRSKSFKLTGNIFERETGREATQADVWAALTQLFEEQERRQHPVEGVARGLSQIAEAADIVFLTNMPHQFGEHRRAHLLAHDLPYPLVTNTGTKATGIAALKRGRPSVGFVDDTPVNLAQVAEAHPEIALFHFMADDVFRGLIEPMENVSLSTGDWLEAAPHIAERLRP